MADELGLGACGIDCASCGIWRANTDAAEARRIAESLTKSLGRPVSAADIHCGGCRGDRARHWSADCGILACCVDQRGLTSCAECGDLPCGRLRDFGARNRRYSKAVQRLLATRDRQGQASKPGS